MYEHGVARDLIASFPTQSQYDATITDLRMDALDDDVPSARVALNTDMQSSQDLTKIDRENKNDDETASAAASVSITLDNRNPPVAEDSDSEASRVGCRDPQTAERESLQSQDARGDSFMVSPTRVTVHDDYASPKPRPLLRHGSSFAHPTKASLAWQSERAKTSLSRFPQWKPAGSPSASRPGSAHDNDDQGLHSRSIPRSGAKYGRDERVLISPSKRTSRFFEFAPRQEEPRSGRFAPDDIEHHLGDAELQFDVHERPYQLATTANHAETDQEGPEEQIHTNNNELSGEERLSLAAEVDKDPEKLGTEMEDMIRDFDLICDAWLKVYGAVSVRSYAVEGFRSYIAQSTIHAEIRAAARGELTTNELCKRVTDMQDNIQLLQMECDRKDNIITVHKARPVVDHESDTPSLENTSIDWRAMYEKEQRRFDSLKEQHKWLRSEAERMYQPDLERKYKECQASLIDAQDRIDALIEDLATFEKEALSWKHEFERLQEELARRSARFEQQAEIGKQELLCAAKEYRDKVEDSTQWDNKGLLVKYERLEREHVVLAIELENIKRSDAKQRSHIEELNRRHQQDHAEIQSLLKTRTAIAHEMRRPASETITQLRERRGRLDEEEDAREALKEKLRQLRYKSVGLPTALRLGDESKQYWYARWRADDHFEQLTEEEKHILMKLRQV